MSKKKQKKMQVPRKTDDKAKDTLQDEDLEQVSGGLMPATHQTSPQAGSFVDTSKKGGAAKVPIPYPNLPSSDDSDSSSDSSDESSSSGSTSSGGST